MSTPVIVALITTVGGACLGWMARRFPSRVDAFAVLTDGAMGIIDQLQEQVDRLDEKLRAVEAEVEDCERRYDRLRRACRDAGIAVDGEHG